MGADFFGLGFFDSLNISVRSRRRLILASCKAKTSQKYHWSTCPNTRRSSAVKPSLASRWRNASPSSRLRCTSAGRFIVGCSLTIHHLEDECGFD